MNQDFTLEVVAENSFTVLNRIVNVLNRRRVRIKSILAHEYINDFRRGEALILVHTSADMMMRVKHQLEKLIEVEDASFHDGEEQFYKWVGEHPDLKSKSTNRKSDLIKQTA